MNFLTSIEQAEHNEKVCNYISKKPDFSDWIVTIAFYSAIHYLRHLILPYNDSISRYDTFEDLFSSKKNVSEGKHGFQCRFVRDNHCEIAFQYKRLYDMSNNARYNYYAYEREDGTLAKGYLKDIKDYVLINK